MLCQKCNFENHVQTSYHNLYMRNYLPSINGRQKNFFSIPFNIIIYILILLPIFFAKGIITSKKLLVASKLCAWIWMKKVVISWLKATIKHFYIEYNFFCCTTLLIFLDMTKKELKSTLFTRKLLRLAFKNIEG